MERSQSGQAAQRDLSVAKWAPLQSLGHRVSCAVNTEEQQSAGDPI
ncbi:hypothetical protein [Leucobacter musarum]|nr:hypothetical protein [Leucobacter musarum]